MKICTALILLVSALYSHTAFAQIDTSTVPICKDDEYPLPTPCKLKLSDAYAAVADMMIANREGLIEVARQAPGIKDGLTDGFLLADVRVTYVKSEEVDPRSNSGFRYRDTTQYEVLLNDCRGTDACNGTFLWTVTQVELADGYTSERKYTNKIEKTEIDRLDNP